MKLENVRKYIKQAIIIFSSLILGSLITIFIKDTNCKNNNNTLSYSYGKFEPLYETYYEIKNKFYNKVDDDTLIDGAINGMMESLGDEHSVYFDKESKEQFDLELSGSYYGIGAEITKNIDGSISISRIFDESPAFKAGLKTGDLIIKVDGESTKDKTASDVANAIKNGKSKIVNIVISRNNEEKTYKITKENVTLYSVSSDTFKYDKKNIGYIAVSIFGDKTYKQFLNSLNKLENDGINSLIIDLRNNSGGYLTTVTDMLDIFIDKGNVIYKIQTQNGIIDYKATSNSKRDYDIVILVNENSASASEIMTAAMKEVYGAKIVGKNTYGKGTVQTTTDLSNGTMIKYTIEKWLTSNGNSIDKEGIKPDYDVDLSENYNLSPSYDNDDQLQKAIQLLK